MHRGPLLPLQQTLQLITKAPFRSSDTMERRADPSTQLEIDQAILDYLVYSTIKALIRDYKATRHNDGGQVNGSTCVGTMLELVDCRSLCSLHRPETHGSPSRSICYLVPVNSPWKARNRGDSISFTTS